MTQTVQPSRPRITTIRPTMSMVSDLLPHAIETWILDDCAIGETKKHSFVALVVIRLEEYNECYYGFIPNLRTYGSLIYTRERLDYACENFLPLQPKTFDTIVDWAHIKAGTGNRYM